ncbi:hypothetical protein [Thiolapillus sp.]
MKTIIFGLVLAFSTLSMAETLPDGHPSIPQSQGGKILVHEGTVISTIPTKNYTYVEIQQGDEIIWLAMQKKELPDGAKIRYAQGAVMKNFYSNTLNKEFPSILFVQSVEIVKE